MMIISVLDLKIKKHKKFPQQSGFCTTTTRGEGGIFVVHSTLNYNNYRGWGCVFVVHATQNYHFFVYIAPDEK